MGIRALNVNGDAAVPGGDFRILDLAVGSEPMLYRRGERGNNEKMGCVCQYFDISQYT